MRAGFAGVQMSVKMDAARKHIPSTPPAEAVLGVRLNNFSSTCISDLESRNDYIKAFFIS